MSQQITSRRNAVCLCLLSSFLVLLFATTSSFLYATNFWMDSNIYFTIGRGIRHGLYPYRDLFDHKGPLIFLLYGIGAWISETSFLGIFLLEVLSLFIVLYTTYHFLNALGCGKWSLCMIPVLAVITGCCTAFNQGGSAEEFCLPALVFLVCSSVLEIIESGKKWSDLLCGVSLGFLFWSKLNLCGIGLTCVFICLFRLSRHGLSKALMCMLRMLAGFALISCFTILWLSIHGILQDCFKAYFIENMTDYSGQAMTFKEHLYNAKAYLLSQGLINPAVLGFAVLGFLLPFFLHAQERFPKILSFIVLPISACAFLVTVYWNEMAHPYYALVFAALVPPGLAVCTKLLDRILGYKQPKMVSIVLTLLLIISPVFTHFFCQASCLWGIQKEDMPQTQFAEIIHESEVPTLLDLSGHDQGFYLAAGILPTCRYFCDNNLNTEEKFAAISEYLSTARTEFVVTCYRDPGPNYEKIAEADGYFGLRSLQPYKLYRRIESEEQ